MEAVNLSSAPADTAPTQRAEIVDSVGADYKAYTPLYERFDIRETKDDRVNRNLEMIWKWAEARSETKDKDSILWEVTKLNNRLGRAVGSAPYTRVLTYISEYNRMRLHEERLKEMEAHAGA